MSPTSEAPPARATQLFTIHPSNKHTHPTGARPAFPSGTEIPLNAIDLIAPVHMRYHRIFHAPDPTIHTSTSTEVIENLKSSLREALELYPPAGGVVRQNKDGELCVVLDSGVGTQFVVESRPGERFVRDEEGLGPRTEMVLPPPATALAVKVTTFSCGTIAVATSMHHLVVDLGGFLDFIEVWAQLARGEPIDYAKLPNDWTHNPSRFFTEFNKNSPHDATASSPSTPQDIPIPKGFQVLQEVPTAADMPLWAPAETTRWKFTKASIERLKHALSPPATSGEWISSGDALSALAWGAITRARHVLGPEKTNPFGASPTDISTETLSLAADGRDRLPPPARAGPTTNNNYFGNFNLLPSITVPSADLLTPKAPSTARVALQIRRALKAQLSPPAIAERLAFMEDTRNFTPPRAVVLKADVAMTNWCWWDFRDEKFGLGWGRPAVASMATGGEGLFPPGYSILMRGEEEGSVVVLLTVEGGAVEALKGDGLLTEYATLMA